MAKYFSSYQPTYTHVLILAGVVDRNGEVAYELESGKNQSTDTSSLLLIEYFAEGLFIQQRLNRTEIAPLNVERLCGPAPSRFL